jgi:TolA-binding protein
MASTTSPEPTEGSSENVYVLSLQKSMRAINKKLSGMAKTDAVIKENPDVSLDDLVSQRKINQDQKASALKKPHLQAQLITLEEQVQQYKKFDADLQQQLQKQKSELTSNHGEELEKLKSELQAEAAARSEAELKSKLLIFSQFLRAAADRRNAEHDEEDDENRAFEGTLLLVYGGDQKAVDTALSLIEGSDEQVTSIEGSLLPVKCKFSHIIGCDVVPSLPDYC